MIVSFWRTFCDPLPPTSFPKLVLCLWVRSGTYSRVEHLKSCFTQVGFNFTHEHYTSLEKLARNQHCCLLWTFLNYTVKVWQMHLWGNCWRWQMPKNYIDANAKIDDNWCKYHTWYFKDSLIFNGKRLLATKYSGAASLEVLHPFYFWIWFSDRIRLFCIIYKILF